MNTPIDRHLNQVELARRWSLSPRTLERWRWQKQGPAYLKIGGRVVYRLEDIELFETAQMHRQAPDPAKLCCVTDPNAKPEVARTTSGHRSKLPIDRAGAQSIRST